MTTWDGHLRIDHLADAATVTLTLVTVEPATEMPLRAGLVAGFVTADPHGPPAFVEVALRDGQIPVDIAALLGPRVSAAVADMLATNRPGQWLQLDLIEIDDLAAAWAPYRMVTLESGLRESARSGALGSWANELWTCLGLTGWCDALRSIVEPGPQVQFRGGDRPPRYEDEPGPPEIRGNWRLPDELAKAVGVEPDVAWSLRPAGPDAVEIEMRARLSGQPARAVLQTGLDDGSQRWVPFEADDSGGLRARLVSSDEPVRVRFRSDSGRLG